MMITPDAVGIDVSKRYLDIFEASSGRTERVANQAQAIADLAARLQDRFVIFEATGVYDQTLRLALQRAAIAYARVNPGQARSFAKSAGFLAKTDRIDARMLAAFGSAVRPRPAEPASESQTRLARLHKRRDQLVGTRKQERARKSEVCDLDLVADLDRHLAFLDAEIATLERKMIQLIASEPSLKNQYELITSIPGVGPITAITLLALLPELGRRSPKTIAALVGLAPVNNDSGQMRGQRSIRGGRGRVRQALYMAAVAASRSHSRFADLYERLRAEQKPAKLALIALARRLLVTANAVVRDQQAFAA